MREYVRATRRAVGLFSAWLLLLSLTVDCSHRTPFIRDSSQAPSQTPTSDQTQPVATLAQRIILIGDAGKNEHQTPVLRTLTARAQRQASLTSIVFLGDNIYPNGLESKDHPNHSRSLRRLRSQVQAAKASGAEFFFIPGNHDWAQGGQVGKDNLKRAEALVLSEGGDLAHHAPPAGDPGPTCLDKPWVRLVFIDTEELIRRFAEDAPGLNSALEAVRRCTAEAPHHALVLGHHPMHSRGIHGNFFTFRQHVFPLTEIYSWLYLPLPIVGSLYPAVRSQGISRQDLAHSANAGMFQALRDATNGRRPLLYAGAHDHSLQLHESEHGPLFSLVSGSGSVTDPVSSDDSTLYAHEALGFMELDFFEGGDAVLTVVAEDPESGSFSSTFQRRLSPAKRIAP